LLLDAGVPVHVVAARIGDDPATLLRIYVKRTKKADKTAAKVIEDLSASVVDGGTIAEQELSNTCRNDTSASVRSPLLTVATD
jgi:hypothetical protein